MQTENSGTKHSDQNDGTSSFVRVEKNWIDEKNECSFETIYSNSKEINNAQQLNPVPNLSAENISCHSSNFTLQDNRKDLEPKSNNANLGSRSHHGPSTDRRHNDSHYSRDTVELNSDMADVFCSANELLPMSKDEAVSHPSSQLEEKGPSSYSGHSQSLGRRA